MKIEIDDDCGNAPKRQKIADLLVRMAKNEHDGVQAYLADDVAWELVGFGPQRGRDQLADLLDHFTDPLATTFTVANILSHGSGCAANGTLRRQDGTVVAFAHFFRFNGHGKNATIRRVTSFMADSEDT